MTLEVLCVSGVLMMQYVNSTGVTSPILVQSSAQTRVSSVLQQ